MAWPPTIPPNDRTNATPTVDAHASDHNTIANALTDLVARMPMGLIKHYDVPADGSLTTSNGILTVGSFNWPGLANRVYAIHGVGGCNLSANGDIANYIIADGATRLIAVGYTVAGTYNVVPLIGMVKTGATARTITLQVQLQCSLGTARMKVQSPSWLDVYDMGRDPAVP